MSRYVDISLDRHVARVTLDRPDKRNALNLDMLHELVAAGERLAADRAVRCVVLAGNGGHFCAGIDTSLLADPEFDVAAVLADSAGSPPGNVFQRAALVWRELPVPVLAAIRGVAFGAGLQVACGADCRYAHPDAQLSIMEIRWGLVPDMALSVTLRGVAALDRIRELAYTGRVVDAAAARQAGLVTAVCPDPLGVAMETAGEIAGWSPDAVRAMKSLFGHAFSLDDAAALQLEAETQAKLAGGPAQREAVAAAAQGRAPDFGSAK